MSRTSEPMPMPAARPEAVAVAAPARPVRVDGLAIELGFPTSQALKKWLERRDLPHWLDGGHLWTDRAAIDEHIARVASASMATKPTSPAPAPAPPVSDDALLSTLKQKRGR